MTKPTAIDTFINYTLVEKHRPKTISESTSGKYPKWDRLLFDMLVERRLLQGRPWKGFGVAVQLAVETFQHNFGLAVDGIVGAHTWAALSVKDWHNYGEVVMFYARWHAFIPAREIGGNNRGKWVKKFGGAQGLPWCVFSASYYEESACKVVQIPRTLTECASSSKLVLEGLKLRQAFATKRQTIKVREFMVDIPLLRDLNSILPCYGCLKGGSTGVKHTVLVWKIKDGYAYVIEGNVRPRKWNKLQSDCVEANKYKVEDLIFVSFR